MTDARSRRRILVALAAGCVLLGVVLVASWNHLLPGGWRLRALLEDPAERWKREHREHREQRLRAFAAENRKAPAGSIVFLGSSAIERFDLARTFPGKPCLNRGIGAETALEILERLDASLPLEAPAGLVLYTGGRDHRAAGLSVEQTLADVGHLLDELRRRYRDVPITLIEVLPGLERDDLAARRLRQVNSGLRDLAHSRGLDFLPVARPPLCTPQGTLAAEHAADRWHLNASGYRVLARWLIEEGGDVGRLLAP